MVKEIFNGLVRFLPRWTYARPVVFILGIIGAGWLYIHIPKLPIVGGQVVRLAGDQARIELPASINFCEIHFRRQVRLHPYVVTPIGTTMSSSMSVNKGEEVAVNNPTSIIRIFPTNSLSKDVLNSSESIAVTLQLFRGQSAEITKVVIDGDPIEVDDFHRKYVKTASARLISTRSIRNDISIILKKYNEVFSNYILSAMVASAAALLGALAYKFILNILLPDFPFVLLTKWVYGIKNITDSGLLEKARHTSGIRRARLERLSKLFQVLGPAVGFMLTVSSLIVALDATIYGNSDITIFFSSIQVAMVSTFMGLFIRVESVILQSLNNASYIRRDDVFAMLGDTN